jgi:hypothetical protein
VVVAVAVVSMATNMAAVVVAEEAAATTVATAPVVVGEAVEVVEVETARPVADVAR